MTERVRRLKAKLRQVPGPKVSVQQGRRIYDRNFVCVRTTENVPFSDFQKKVLVGVKVLRENPHPSEYHADVHNETLDRSLEII